MKEVYFVYNSENCTRSMVPVFVSGQGLQLLPTMTEGEGELVCRDHMAREEAIEGRCQALFNKQLSQEPIE